METIDYKCKHLKPSVILTLAGFTETEKGWTRAIGQQQRKFNVERYHCFVEGKKMIKGIHKDEPFLTKVGLRRHRTNTKDDDVKRLRRVMEYFDDPFFAKDGSYFIRGGRSIPTCIIKKCFRR